MRQDSWILVTAKDSQKILRTVLRSVKLLIVDEVSMLSSLNLAYMHLCRKVFGGELWFGGLNVLFIGDLLQLPPLMGGQCLSR